MRRIAATAVLAAGLLASAMPAARGEAGQDEQQGTLLGSYLSGVIARSNHDTQAAAKFFSHALSKDPGNDTLLESAYMLVTIDGNWERAFQLAERLIKNEPSHRVARYVLAARALKEGQPSLAIQHLNEAKSGPISDLTTTLVLAWIRLAQGDGAAALDTVDAVRDADWSRLFQKYHRALVADLAGLDREAAEAYAEAFETNQRSARIAEAYARFAASRGDLKRAREILKTNLEQGSDNPQIRALQDAINKGEKIGRLIAGPEEGAAEVFYGLGDVLTSEGGIELGTIYLQLALYLRPDFPMARVALGEVYEASQKYEQAIVTYDSIHANSPLWLNAQIRKALSLNAMDRVEEATALLNRLAEANPKLTRPLDALGNILRSRERYAEAAEAYSRAIALIKTPKKDDWALYYSRGVSYERMGEWPKAEADLKMAMKLNPDQPLILNYLGYSWVDQGQHLKEAMKLIRKAVKLKPDDGYFVDSLGWAYYRMGNFEQATKHLERAVELRPEDPVINDHLGDAYWQVGRRVEAKYQWSQALTLDPEPKDAEKIKKKLIEGLGGEQKQVDASARTTTTGE